MAQCITQQLRTNILSKLNDAALYRELAKQAPRDDVIPLLEIANDDEQQAEDFQCIYQSLTGCGFDPIADTPTLEEPYRDILRNRVLAESEDFRKYGEQSLGCRQNPQLQNALACASINQNVHALNLLALLSQPEPAKLNQVEAAQIKQAETAQINQAQPAQINQAQPAQINQAQPAQINQAQPSPFNQVQAAQINQAQPAQINQAQAAQLYQKPTIK